MSYQKSGYQPVETGVNGTSSESIEPQTPTWKKWTYGLSGALVVLMIASGIGMSQKEAHTDRGSASIKAADIGADGKMKLFDDLNRYVLEDFDAKPNFASFLPGVAGLYGKPVWSFYVNRGQGVASFGEKSKEYPILEFNAANKAYQLTPYIGFRTFIQGSRGETSFDTEPFNPANSRALDEDQEDQDALPKRVMYVGPNEFEVKEVDHVNGLETSAKYVVLPEEDFAALVRRLTLTNTGDSDLTLSALDGLAKMEPVGGKLDWGLKNMGRTLEGWFGVYHADDTLNMPFFRMSTEPSDTASVKIEKAGHYVISFIEDDEKPQQLLPIIYDTNAVFGQDSSLLEAKVLQTKSVSDVVEGTQYGDAKTSSAFAAIEDVVLAPGESITIASFYGKAEVVEDLPKIAETVSASGYVSTKFDRARSMMDELTAGVETNSTNKLFNGAIKQMFLDNSLRGGMPVILGDVDESAKMSNFDEDPRIKVFHTFSRIHGDLERDYNAFMIDTTFFSQGPGNYRDVAQNRREDVTLNPRVGAFNVKMFLSYIQADGYEPLTVEAVVYMVTDPNQIAALASTTTADEQSGEVLEAVLKGGPFRPGQLLDLVEQLNIKLNCDKQDFLDHVVGIAENIPMATFGQGYWADHWEYYLDLIESYLAIYPDGEESLMYDNELRYFFSTATVKPRSEKYVETMTYDGKGKHILQLDATEFDTEKEKEQEAFRSENTGIIGIDAYWQRTKEGDAFKSAPIAKLFLLGAMKFATRDSYGMGIEYEGGRPGWNDAMNGLPGMVGSGMPETYETYLLLKYVKNVTDKYGRSIVIPAELNTMIETVNTALNDLEESGYKDPEVLPYDVPEDLFNYWDVVASARENYRNDVQYYFSGDTAELSAGDVSDMIGRWLAQVEMGMGRAAKFGSHGYEDDGTSGVPPSYFSYNITDWTRNEGKNKVGLPLVNARAMKVGQFPLFLEGPVRYMKTIVDDQDALKSIYQNVLASGLRDESLKMYKVSANLKGQSYDMGRMMAFAPGWLENESIWMHMSYKYYLELIRGGLYEEFFREMKEGGILPFMNPDVYGRSLMECSSFLASSAFPDPKTRGRGFSARLSGSTAEFLSMWKVMFIGQKPFYMNENGELEMKLVPALPNWLFKEEGLEPQFDENGQLIVSFKLFASIIVTYHNPSGGDLFNTAPKSYKVTMEDGTVESIDGSEIPSHLAKQVRKMYGVASIDAYF
uniref:Uncharacterized protein n=1 Tax=Odontella aurita TaxID=265563 RepID=A0A7S4M4S5_9STRA|mmetsp:Transcript_11057/g.32791  ORF Transcript_11057/g.32791 Transcript_11057/m.32791 type:complete len:1218 (+) Transcript_11057:187-3840(+)